MTTDRVVMSNRRSPSASCTERTYTGAFGAPAGGSEQQDGAGCAGTHHQMGRPEVAHGQRGGAVGDPRHPADEQARRHVDHRRGDAADQAGHQPGRQSPHHHRGGRGHCERVGQEPPDRGAAERRHQDGRHAGLRRDRDREHLAQELGATEPASNGRRQQHDAGRRRDRQLEADGVDQQRVDEDQPGDRQRQQPDARGRSTGGGGRHRERNHRRRPQDGRLEAGHQAEEPDRSERHGQSRPQPEPAQERADQREHERHVLARHGEQVRESGGAERLGSGQGLVPGVAEHEAREQRPVHDVERIRTGEQRAANAVGELRQRAAAAVARTARTSSRPTTWRTASQSEPGGEGPMSPRTRTRSPARRSRMATMSSRSRTAAS